ncbi:hypothetical protein M422DRAFT_56464 [Sphaerobolus stellatus SS14]|uniref:Uncharacterized protein n=1 Tax=Sphaerobolus stellatus (strain SS14) TaxID=990650 RepID=A0A0C9U583_SPHS4|nr:hypothetical protein M422DRAFT_56464 [Sphaerobolus stellatus SS14]
MPTSVYFPSFGDDGGSEPPNDSSPASESSSSTSDSSGDTRREHPVRGTPLDPRAGGTNAGRDDSRDSSSSSSSSSSSDSDSSSSERKQSPSQEKRRREKKKKYKKQAKNMRKMLSHVKVNPLPVYSGTPNIEILDRWAYAVNNWVEMHALERKWAVRLVANFLGGKASTFYMRHVAHHQKRWTLQQIYDGLFDYCFPPDYKNRLRDRLTSYEQRDLFLVDFAREIENLASKFPDWIDYGFSRESAKWNALVYWATKFEARELQKQKERGTGANMNTGNSIGTSRAKNNRSRGFYNQRISLEPPVKGEETKSAPQAKKRTPMNLSNNAMRNNRPKLSKEEMNQLRAGGRCFNCKEGHESLPGRNSAKISSGSIQFSNLEKLGQQKREVDIQLLGVHFAEDKKSEEKEIELLQDKIYVPWLRKDITDFFGPETALAAGIKPTDRFNVKVQGKYYVISDMAWPGTPLKWQKKFVQQPGFNLQTTLQYGAGWKEKMLTDKSEEYRTVAEQIRVQFCQEIPARISVSAGVKHGERFTVTHRDGSYVVKDCLKPNFICIIPRSELIQGTWNVPSVLEDAGLALEEEDSDAEDELVVQIKKDLRKFFGPEDSYLHDLTPSTRFTVRRQMEGVCIQDNVLKELPLFISNEELIIRGFRINEVYSRAAREIEGLDFDWPAYCKQIQEESREQFCVLLWKKFMEYYNWPEDLDDKFGKQQWFTVMEFGKDYEITDWTDVSLSHLLKLEHIEIDNWDVPSILQRTKQLRIDLELDNRQGSAESFMLFSSDSESETDRMEGPSRIPLHAARPTKGKMTKKDQPTDHLVEGIEQTSTESCLNLW